VASLFVSRWDVAVKGVVPQELRNRLGIAVAKRTYKAYRGLLASPRWRRLAAAGARTQRLLWASTGTKDPVASDTLYIETLAAPDTINTIPDRTLLAFAEHGHLRGVMPVDGGDAEDTLAAFRRIGVDDAALATQLQREEPHLSISHGRICWTASRRRTPCSRRGHPRVRANDDRAAATAAGLYLDHSKHRVTDATLGLLLRLAGDGASAKPPATIRVTMRRGGL
jgi:hypothetical protein